VSVIDFDQLVDRHYQPLYRFGLSLAKNSEEAADLTQQTFFLWAAKGHQLRDLSKVKSWLFTTLYREYISTYRHSSRFPHVELAAVSQDLPTIAPAVFNDIDGNTVVGAMTQVDEVYRAPLVLFYLDELSYKEIAEVLDVPIGTVMSRLARGKAQLRDRLLEARHSRAPNLVAFDARAQQRQTSA
jgi:RNA polymerase sigma-70 factor (ECF subfamily)